MNLKINLYGAFRKGFASPQFPLEAKGGLTVKELFSQLQLAETMYKMVLVNGFRVKDNRVLQDGDEVHIFQPIGGG